MGLMEALTLYLHGLQAVVLVLMVVLLVSGIDDLFIDLAYWGRRVWRFFGVYGRHARFNPRMLRKLDEKPLAIMVPAWQAHGMAARMAERMATTLDYENYHVFIGFEANDAQTRREVGQAQARFANVHPVAYCRPGPSSRGEGLNHILQAVFQFEQRAGLTFEGFVLHDLQDVLPPGELRVFNFLVGRKDLIQLPVYPLPRKWYELTGGHYLDELAEMNAKEAVMREALAGQVCSVGMGTCLSRRAMALLRQEGGGVAFDAHSLGNGGKGLGFRLKTRGLREVFACLPAEAGSEEGGARPWGTVAVRRYFPASFSAAVEHKSRWLADTLQQGLGRDGWRGASPAMAYFIWRDRKVVVTHLAAFLALLLALQLTLLWAYGRRLPELGSALLSWRNDAWLAGLLLANAGLLANRLLQRLFFVTSCYGLAQGLLSLPRWLWGHGINFAASCQALRRSRPAGHGPAAWDQPLDQTPEPGHPGPERKRLGQILVLQKALSPAQLATALQAGVRGLRLGSQLVHQGLISAEQLAMALAAQGRVGWEAVDALALPSALLARLPASIALHYAVLPLREEGEVLVLASESNLDPVALAALARKLARPVRYVIAPKGQVVVGLRHAYARQRTLSARFLLDKVLAVGRLTPAEAALIWQEYVSLQLLMGEVLQSLGRLDAAAFSAVLLRQERSGTSLGRFLVREGVISAAALDEVLQLQQQHQVSMQTLLERAGKLPALPSLRQPKVHVA